MVLDSQDFGLGLGLGLGKGVITSVPVGGVRAGYFRWLGLGLGLGKGVITSAPVGGVRAGYFRWCWALGTLATPPFSGTLFPLVAPPSGYKLPFQRYGTFKSVKNAKCVSRERKVVETRGQVWRVQRVRIMSDGSR